MANFKKSFASDNYAGVHPILLQALVNANTGHVPAYGNDTYTHEAIEVFKKHFGSDIDVYFVLTGTGANVLGLQTLIKSYESIICAQTAHINTNECGAPEKFIGSKLLSIPTPMGKLTIEQLKQFMSAHGDQHSTQPRIISLTQATELGTVYTIQEIKNITQFAREHNLYVHMDGARLCNAAAYLNVSLKEITTDTGIDLLSFGGTKNGMLLGEAVIFFNKKLARDFKYIRKQGMQLVSKMRFISAQFTALLENNLWLENARHANKMAHFLAAQLTNFEYIRISRPVETNGVFAFVDPRLIYLLQQEYSFYVWDEQTSEVRWMTSFDTTEEDILNFVQTIKQKIQDI